MLMPVVRRFNLVALLAVLVGLAPHPGRAQECVTVFKDYTAGPVVDGGTVCQTAVDKKCTFHVALCVNQQQEGCTQVDLGKKKSHASGRCLPLPKVKVKANGTSSVCGSF